MDSTFFQQFLMISDIRTILFIAVLVAIFFGISFLGKGKTKLKFSTRMILSTVIGLVLGLLIQLVAKFPTNPSEITWINEVSKWYGLIGNGFIDLLKMLVVPIVLISIIRVIMNMTQDDNIGKLTALSIGSLLSITALSAIIGIVVANIMNLGVGANVAAGSATIKEIEPIADTLRGLLPSNIVDSMAKGNVIAIVIFATFIGLSIRRLKVKKYDKVKVFIDFIESSYTIITSVAITVIKFMPYAVIALLSNVIASRGISSLKEVFGFIIALYISVAIAFVVQMLIVSLFKLNPFRYVKNVLEALVLAFTSRSSLGTLPVTIKVLTENAGIKEGTSTFVGSLGSNMGMNGCAGIYPALMAVTLANMVGRPLDISFYATLIIVIVISSLGIAGLPGTAIMAVSVVISGVGLGEFFPLTAGIIAIDPILDMARTMINVNGTMISAVITSSITNDLDKDIFNSDEKSNSNIED